MEQEVVQGVQEVSESGICCVDNDHKNLHRNEHICSERAKNIRERLIHTMGADPCCHMVLCRNNGGFFMVAMDTVCNHGNIQISTLFPVILHLTTWVSSHSETTIQNDL